MARKNRSPHVRVVHVYEPAEIEAFMNTRQFERAVLQVIRRDEARIAEATEACLQKARRRSLEHTRLLERYGAALQRLSAEEREQLEVLLNRLASKFGDLE